MVWYSQKQDLLHAPIWFSLYTTFIKVCPIPIQNKMHCWWNEIKKSPKYKLNDNIGDLLKTAFSYHRNDTKRNPWVMLCSHCPINVYALPFTLQLCYKPLGILQTVTKSQKVHISRHDLLQKSHTCLFGIYWWTFKNPKNQNFEKIKKKKKKCCRYHHFTYVHQKPQCKKHLQILSFYICTP